MSAEPIGRDLAESIADAQEQRVADRFRLVADRLHEIADRVEREATRPAPTGPTSSARTPLSTKVGQIAHAITWGVANLNLDQLARDAAEADVYRALAERLADDEVPA